LDTATLTVIVSLAAVLISVAGAVAAAMVSRRQQSGKVATSEAAVLWQQAQEMRSMLLEEKQKAEEQRDRLITSYTEQVFPMLSSINQLVQDLSIGVADGVSMVRDISSALGKGDEHAAPPVPRP
jgi:hypothetical protein